MTMFEWLDLTTFIVTSIGWLILATFIATCIDKRRTLCKIPKEFLNRNRSTPTRNAHIDITTTPLNSKDAA